jgi:hypothetical protein
MKKLMEDVVERIARMVNEGSLELNSRSYLFTSYQFRDEALDKFEKYFSEVGDSENLQKIQSIRKEYNK